MIRLSSSRYRRSPRTRESAKQPMPVKSQIPNRLFLGVALIKRREIGGTADPYPLKNSSLDMSLYVDSNYGSDFCTAASSASRTIARSPYRCLSPITMPAYRLLGASICRRSGRATRNVGAGRRTRGDRVPNQTPDRPRADRSGLRAGLPRGVVLMDAGYGCNTQLRAGVSALALTYVAGIFPNTTVWTSDTEPPPPKKWSGRGRRPKRLHRDDGHKPISVEELALGLPRRAWRKITWREGSCERLSSRFARVRVRAAHRDYTLTEPRPEEWLLVERILGLREGDDSPLRTSFHCAVRRTCRSPR